MLLGPNAGGKTTIQNALIQSVFLTNLLGICNASNAVLTPFKYFSLLIDISTDVSKNQSKFMSEVIALDKTLNIAERLSKIKKKSFALNVIDEILEGTNVEESVEICNNYFDALSEYNTVLTIFSHHNLELARLTKENSKLGIENYGMGFYVDKNDNIHKTYKLEKNTKK